jgi:hypothetical protein
MPNSKADEPREMRLVALTAISDTKQPLPSDHHNEENPYSALRESSTTNGLAKILDPSRLSS